MAPGIYNATAYFRGNEYYEPAQISSTFEVYKLNRTVDLVVYDIIYGNTEELQVFVNASGNVTIYVNGTNGTYELVVVQFGTIDKGSYKLNLEGLDVGTYPVEVWYNGNEFYNPAYTSGVFHVVPVNTTLLISDQDIFIWDSEHIDVTVRNLLGQVITNAPGNITLSIEGVTYSQKINNGVARFTIPNLTIGNKLVWAFYDGDLNHIGSRSISSFEVKPRVPVINVTAQNINVGQVENLHIEIPANATGFVIITGNFTKNGIYVPVFENGKADVQVYNLASGTYSVNIKYYGGGLDNYTVAEDNTVFTVSKLNTGINITVEDIFYKEIANITVSVNDNATGLITIRLVNGSGVIREVTLPVLNGKVNLLVDDLAVDTYTVQANYSGDYTYTEIETSATFKVKKITPEITIDSVETNSIRNATVVVHITPGTTGNVTITVNNKQYSGKIENGVARIVIDQLNSGNYTVDAYYPGDRNYTEASATKENAVNIFRYSCYVMNVTAEDTKVDLNTTIIVEVPCDAEGNVSIYINGTFVGNATVENGVAKLNVTQAIHGKYVVNATFIDGKYANKTVTTNYHVFRWNTPMNITVVNSSSIYVGDVVTIIVSVPENITDNVTIEIEGKSYYSKVINGNATFKVSGLTDGGKTVAAFYAGNYKYLPNATAAKFTVHDKIQTELIVVDQGNGTVVVIIPGNGTGNVTITVENKTFNGTAVNGTAVITLTNVTPGVQNITVIYSGDETHTNATQNATANIPKLITPISVNVADIYVGDVARINVTVPVNATGKVRIEINGKEYFAAIDNGVARFEINNLTAGVKTVAVTYAGDSQPTSQYINILL